MKKITFILITMMIILVLTGCGKKNSGPKAVIGEMLDTFDSYIADMNKSDNVDEAIVAMENFTKAMAVLKPKIDQLEKDYPNLKNSFKGEAIPDQFKEFEGRIKEMGPKFGALMGKMMQYMGDPKFQEASKKMQEAMK